jgi:serine/threonine-protein kinase
MTPETLDLENVKEILERALELTPTERPGFVAQACAGDSDLRREVESLLEQEEAVPPWCEGPLPLSPSGNGKPLEPEQRIGPYRIVRRLGAGGMGEVVLAEREDDFEKKVALKVVRPERLSPELALRFHRERQILAQLEHPNVARILDGGTTDDGQPYFVMEYVEGERIDRYCERRALPPRARLEPFLQVCSALELAHRSLVVHRDLKPRNILVNEEGVPKLLDFGIAKRLATPGDEVTGSGQGPMTLKYASPEQIEGRSITTGSDIYSLGVLLYQLLTGRYPYAAAAGDGWELARVIREARPKAPSAAVDDARLRRVLSGDLDSIVLKAMAREPDQRYGSVEQLAEDVRRYLDVRPVAARGDSRTYRASKFVRRHKLALAAVATIVFLSIAFGSTATVLWRQAVDQRRQAVQAREQAVQAREQAVEERERSEEVLEFMKSLFRGSDLREALAVGRDVTVIELLKRGEQTIEEELEEDPLSQAELLATIGEVYTGLGLFDNARAPWERAEYLLRREYPQEDHPALAKAINNLASWFYRTGDYEQAEVRYRESLDMKLRLTRDGIESAYYVIDVPKSQSNLAAILMHRGEYEEAERLYLQALGTRRELGEPEREIAVNLRSLGVLYFTWGNLDQADRYLKESLEMRQRIYQPDNTRVAAALTSLGRLRHAQGRYDEAQDLLTRSLEIRRQRLGDEHLHVALSRLDLARLYLDTGELAAGEAILTPALEILRRERSPDAWEIAEAESVLGGYLLRRSRYEEAEGYLSDSYRKLKSERGERAIYTREALRRLRSLYEAWGRPLPMDLQGGATPE